MANQWFWFIFAESPRASFYPCLFQQFLFQGLKKISNGAANRVIYRHDEWAKRGAWRCRRARLWGRAQGGWSRAGRRGVGPDGALRAFVEAGLHDVDIRLDQQVDMIAQMQGMLQDTVLPGQAAGGGVAE